MSGFSVACGDFFHDMDPEEEWTVAGFATAEAADEYARRFIRASVEACRQPEHDAAATCEAWFRFGEYAFGPTVRSDHGRWCAANPATRPEETDYRALDPRRRP